MDSRRSHSGPAPKARGLRIALTALLVACALLAGAPRPVAAAAGGVTISAWKCPPGTDATATDQAAFATLCAEKYNDLYFILKGSALEGRGIAKATGWQQNPTGQAIWIPQLVGSGPVTISLTESPDGRFTVPPGATSVVFCLQNGVPTLVSADGNTITDVPVPPEGLECDWYVIPGATPTPTPTATPTVTPSATPAPSPTATVSPTPTVTAIPEPTPTRTPEPTPTATVTPTATATQAPTPVPTRVPRTVKGPKKIYALGLLNDATYSEAEAINDDGVVVGKSGKVGSGGLEWIAAVRWDNTGTEDKPSYTIKELDHLPGGVTSDAKAVNNAGQIAGSSSTTDGSVHAVRWGTNGAAEDLSPLPGGTESRATAINGQGVVVGVSTTGPDQALNQTGTHAVRWDESGEPTDLGTLPGGDQSVALAINDAGVVVGRSTASDGKAHAVVWDADGRISDLALETAVYPLSINASGMIAGLMIADDQFIHAFVLVDGQPVDLGTLEKTYTSNAEINDGGVVVGYTCSLLNCPSGADFRAVLWQNGKVIDLNDLLSDNRRKEWLLQAAFGIDNAGRVVGTGVYGVDDPSGGVTLGFVLWTGATGSAIPQATGGAGTSEATAIPTTAPESKALPAETELFKEDRYLRDRTVLLKPDGLNPVWAIGESPVYAQTAEPPFAALYVEDPENPSGGLWRYLPEHLDNPSALCPAEAAYSGSGVHDAEGNYWVFAGIERDMTTAMLVPTGQAGARLWKDATSVYPEPELFEERPEGLARLVLVPSGGAPALLTSSPFRFAGQRFDLTDQRLTPDAVPTNLVGVGCAGPFRVKAKLNEDPKSFVNLYVQVGSEYFVFRATQASGSATSAYVDKEPLALADQRGARGFGPGALVAVPPAIAEVPVLGLDRIGESFEAATVHPSRSPPAFGGARLKRQKRTYLDQLWRLCRQDFYDNTE